MYRYLDKIKSPKDIKNLNNEELNELCSEIRKCLIETISKNGGHLASNLGVVELTVALHLFLDCPNDTLLFDVGHQCYTHKILTGRFDRISSIRKENGLSGFMRPDESEYDPFVTGHSSNSISAALGICKAKELKKDESLTVVVVGDGAMTGGMIFEGLNNAGRKNNKIIVVLNDNKMSISKNVGGLARYLTIIRSKSGYHRFKHKVEHFFSYIPFIGKRINRNLLRSKKMLKNAIYHSNVFENMGFRYFGPVDGHNIQKITEILEIAKNENRPALIHVLTQKGKGYSFAEDKPDDYHGVSAFDIDEGGSKIVKNDFSHTAGDELCILAQNDDKICAVTAAMTAGTGLEEFSRRFKSRFFDVGIAEEHGVTFSAGLASLGLKPYFAVYSTFLQRGYDQIIHDAAIANYNLTFLVDRAGIVGEDGETHQGIFDIAFLRTIPNMKIFSPSNYLELRKIIDKTAKDNMGITAIRYPRGVEVYSDFKNNTDSDFSIFGNENSKTLVVTFGRIFNFAYELINYNDFCLMKLNKIFPLSNECFAKIEHFDTVHVFEEGIKSGGIGEYIASNVKNNISIHAIENQFVKAGKIDSLLNILGLDREGIKKVL